MTNRSLTYEAGEQARSRFHDRPMRFFNTAGPIIPADHYHVHPLQRLDLDEVLLLIERKQYFVLHAPRQTGKTSALLALMEELNGSGRYRCVYVNVEIGQSAREDMAEAMRAILGQLASRAEQILGNRSLREVVREVSEEAGPHGVLQEVLGRWAAAGAKPLVLMIDEIDALIGDTLLAVLRQLRAGYPERPRRFPQSVILCGVRDVRDYRIRLEELAEKEGEEAGKEVHQEEGTTRLANLIDKDPLFEKCVTDRRLLAAVRHVIGDDLRLSSLNARASHPGQGLQGFHADWGTGVEPGEFQVCNSVWLLTDFTAENGATRVVPGSHLSRKTPAEAMEDPTDLHPEQVQLQAPAGTVVVFNGHLWHGGTFNASGCKRWGMHGYYCRRSVAQQTDQRRWLSPGTVARLSPQARAVVDVDDP